MSSINQQMGAREWAMLLGLALLWGGSFFFVEIAIDAVSPLAIVFLRIALAAIALWCFSLFIGLSIPRDRRIWMAFAVMAALNNVIPFSLIVWGQRDIGSALASILNAATPFLTVLVAGACLPDERMTPNKLIGVIIGFFGVAMVVGFSSVIHIGQNLIAQLTIIGAAFSYACARRVRPTVQTNASRSNRGCDRSGHDVQPCAPSIDARFWFRVAIAEHRVDGLASTRGSGALFYGARLHPVFPTAGKCWCHEFATRDVVDTVGRHGLGGSSARRVS
nr:DMT family transporter [Salinisphaera sp. Q1T1-3]